MIANLKLGTAAFAISGLMVLASITAPFAKMFGKHYNENKDFSCCKKDQLVLHHYYTVNVFWIEVSDGYTEENTGKAIPGGCIIKCAN